MYVLYIPESSAAVDHFHYSNLAGVTCWMLFIRSRSSFVRLVAAGSTLLFISQSLSRKHASCKASERRLNVDDIVPLDKKFNAIPLVYEKTCPHIKNFQCCPISMTVYASNIPILTKADERLVHKAVLITPSFGPPFVMQISQGNNNLIQSGCKMECCDCAKFKSSKWTKEDTFFGVADYHFLDDARRPYADKVRLFGPSKYNCQIFSHFLIDACHASPMGVMQTRAGKGDQIHDYILGFTLKIKNRNWCSDCCGRRWVVKNLLALGCCFSMYRCCRIQAHMCEYFLSGFALVIPHSYLANFCCLLLRLVSVLLWYITSLFCSFTKRPGIISMSI